MKTMIFLMLAIAGVLVCACQENDRLLYDDGMHDVYFAGVTAGQDTAYVSLLTADDVSVTEVKVSLLGNVLPVARKFRVEVVEEATDAEEGVHYRKLPEYYEFPAEEFTYAMPVTLLKGDEKIKEGSVTLTLRLVGTEELGVAYADKAEIHLKITDRLRRPAGERWYDDMPMFVSLFGEYSQTKHLMIIGLVGHDFWDNVEELARPDLPIYSRQDYYLPYARQLCKIITGSAIPDENGKVMEGWLVP